MKKIKYLVSVLFLLILSVSAEGAANRVCDYTVGSTTTATGFANCTEEVAKLYERGIIATTGVAGTNTITASSSPAVTALVDGLTVYVKAANTNSGATTFALDGTAAASITNVSGTALGSGDIVSGTQYVFKYQASPAAWVLIGATGPGAATASAPYIMVSNTAALTTERALTASSTIAITDNGANSTIVPSVIANSISNAEIRQGAAKSIIGVTGAATANVADITGTANQVLRINAAANAVAFGAIDVSSTAAVTGILNAASFPAMTGDVITVAGALASTISTNAVTNAKAAQMATLTIKGNNTGGTANALDLTVAQVNTMINSTVAPVFTNITSRPTTLSGYGITDAQGIDSDLTALAGNTTAGLWASTAVGSGTARTLTAPAAGFTITNPAGTAGNPTFVLANDLAAYEGLAANGFVARTGTDAAAVRTITGTANEVTLTNGDGVAGNPTISLPSALSFTGKTITGGNYAAITGIGIRSTGSGAFDLTLANTENLTAARTLTITTGDAARTLTMTGNASITGTNTGDQIITLTGDVTGAGSGSFPATIPAGTVTNAKMANMAAHTIKANITAGAAAAVDSSLSTIMDAELGSTQGVMAVRNGSGWVTLGPGTAGQVPTSQGPGADWIMGTPSGGGSGSPGGLNTQVQINNAGAFDGITDQALAARLVTAKYQSQTSAYTVVAADRGKTIDIATNAVTLSLDAAATLGDGFFFFTKNSNTNVANTLTIDPNGAETIDGVSTLVDTIGVERIVFTDGTTWRTKLLGNKAGYDPKPSVATEPSATASGNIVNYAQDIAGRPMPKFKGPMGRYMAAQEAFWNKNITMWRPTTATGGSWVGAVNAGVGAGTYTSAGSVTTNLLTAMPRGRWANVVTTANQVLGIRTTDQMFWRSSTNSHGGGFFHARFGFDVWTNGGRFFAGWHTATTVVSANPSALANTLGFLIDSGDNGLISFSTRDATTLNKVSTGLTATTNSVYDVFIYLAPNSSTVYWTIVDVVAGTTVSGNTSSNLPVVNTVMTPGVLASNAALTPVTSIQLAVNRIYTETEN